MLNPVIALTITDFTLFDNSSELIHNFKLIEKKQFIEYSDDIELIFIELLKFRKTDTELHSIQVKWLPVTCQNSPPVSPLLLERGQGEEILKNGI